MIDYPILSLTEEDIPPMPKSPIFIRRKRFELTPDIVDLFISMRSRMQNLVNRISDVIEDINNT